MLPHVIPAPELDPAYRPARSPPTILTCTALWQRAGPGTFRAHQGRYGLRPPRPLLREGRPLTAGFPGKIGTGREDGQEWSIAVNLVPPA